MTETHPHKLLVVDTDKSVFTAFENLLKEKSIECQFARTGESALKLVKESRPRFSIIIAEHRLEGMDGIKFLKNAQELSPFSSLFLMSDHSDTQAIVKAVNLGIIQRYIKKPLEEKRFCATLQSGIKSYEFLIDSEKLFRLAKNQNKKLYELNCELMENAKSHTRELEELEEEINLIKKQIEETSQAPDSHPEFDTEKLKTYLDRETNPKPDLIKELYCRTVQELHSQFGELALRKGFEMPPIKSVEDHESE